MTTFVINYVVCVLLQMIFSQLNTLILVTLNSPRNGPHFIKSTARKKTGSKNGVFVALVAVMILPGIQTY